MTMNSLVISNLKSTPSQQIGNTHIAVTLSQSPNHLDEKQLTTKEQALIMGGLLTELFCPSPGQSFGDHLDNWMSAGALSGMGVGFFSGGLPGLAIGTGLGLAGGVGIGFGSWLLCD
jgi:hypothetical protein